MTYPLSSVHTLIYEHARPAVLLKYPEVVHPQHELWLLLQKDIKEARVEFLNRFVQVGGMDSLRATVYTYQVTCINLLNRLSEYRTLTEQSAPAKASADALGERYADVQSLLTGELRYLQTHYSLFFDLTQPVPVCVWQKKQKEWSALLTLLHHNWAEAGTEPQLLQLLFAPLQKRITETTYPCYAELKYLHQLLAETELADTSANLSATRQLSYILCRNNYNDPRFIHFLYRQIQCGITEDDSLSDQADYWALQLKQYQNLYCYDAKWLPQLPSVNHAIDKMVRQELMCCERNIKSNSGFSQPAPGQPQPVITNLSVGQLAVMMRLLVDCGIIACTNQSELLKRIAAAVVTTKQNKISAESLRVKYYAPDSAALTIANEYIVKMMGMVRKY